MRVLLLEKESVRYSRQAFPPPSKGSVNFHHAAKKMCHG